MKKIIEIENALNLLMELVYLNAKLGKEIEITTENLNDFMIKLKKICET
ncbi:MAG: hypothetical protein AABY22_20850 [Nanoarchaeota archaeon]